MPPTPRNHLLSLLNGADGQILFRQLKEFSGEPGLVLQEAGEPIDYIYFPTSGMISLLAVMQDGSAIETAMIGNEGAVGVVTALGGKTAISRGVVQLAMTSLRIGKEAFLHAYNQSDAVRLLMHRANTELMVQIQQTAACNALHRVDTRLARWLLQCQDRVPGPAVALTQELLAEMLGVRRTSVTQVAQALQTEGLIKYIRGHIEIVDREGLERHACECYQVLARQRQNIVRSTESRLADRRQSAG